MADYADMSTDDFDRILKELLRAMSAEQLLDIPGIYEIVSEEYKNEVLDRWEAEQPEPDDEEEETTP